MLAAAGGVLIGLAVAGSGDPAAALRGMQPVVPSSVMPAEPATAPISTPFPRAPEMSGVRFGYCHSGGGRNCVVDGDTFRLGGEKIRIADIDAPETHPPRCPYEAELGERATRRLQALLNAGGFALEDADRDTDRYGRKLRIVTRGGESIGEMLVDEGLARPWGGRREPWC